MFGGDDDPVSTLKVEEKARSGPGTLVHSTPAQPKTGTTSSRYPAPTPADEARTQTAAAPGPVSAPATDGYRFRPLSERERARSSTYPGADQGVWRPTPGQPPNPAWDSDTRWAQEGYNFRPIKPAPGGGTRWQAPQPFSPWGTEPGASGQWADQLDIPPWRSPTAPPRPATSPPAQRMLPSLDGSGTRTFTAR